MFCLTTGPESTEPRTRTRTETSEIMT
jgi:hypothetical protein